MVQYEIEGGYQLEGEIDIQGSKNAALPILAATVLHKGISRITHCPKIHDVECMLSLLTYLGCKITHQKNGEIVIDATHMESRKLPEAKVKELRASVLFLGSLLSRFGEAQIVYPGGCSIGERPIDFHLSAFEKMGVTVKSNEEEIVCKGKMKGTTIALPFPSVGATENIILAAVLAKGTTIIYGAAKEPEICCLCEYLRKMGAKIFGDGENIVVIEGVTSLHDTKFAVCSDRIVAATYSCAVMVTGGDIMLKMNHSSDLKTVFEALERMGARIFDGKDFVAISMRSRPKAIPFIATGPYPEFPTDVQSQLLAVLCTAEGTGIVEENVFSARFDTVYQLVKMGANIHLVDKRAYVFGVNTLQGKDVEASDLRGGAALVIAGLGAEGITRVSNIGYLERGYEKMVESIQILGGKICVK